jgi:multimeric flavodoxin WrbA
MATWLIISGSPYAQGTCARIAEQIKTSLYDLDPHTNIHLFSVATLNVHGCIGCNVCKDDFTCIYQDDQNLVREALESADAALIISPIYFAGVPSQLKAVLDRLQPYYWKRQEYLDGHDRLPDKRPFYLALVGEGGDPYGAEPAVPSLTSALALVDFKLARMHAFIAEDEQRIYEKLTHQIRQAHKEVCS